ncbi:Ig-like domain-containing protein [Arthrobacter sp. ISL-28]|uniref:CBM96 family carbohydrate-binding protein n=1 Tax=Arthrobacter sp. ISL-28 TaxID=2819108 RepID=UPI00203617FF|nr:Ig-like domain-containing protein [Arthrobacter sp. ISL-28]
MKKPSPREPGGRPALRRLGVSLILLTAILGVPAPASAAGPATTRASVASDGTQANGSSGSAEISADGRYVAFESSAPNLVPGDTNNSSDVFVHDRGTGAMERVSVASDGTQANRSFGSSWPAISADGRYVAFVSFADNLVPGDTNGWDDVFVHDRVTGSTERINVASDGTQANGHSFYPAISGDGRYVAFHSFATSLMPDDTNNDNDDVFVRDRVTGITERVSAASDGTQANRESFGAAISADGRYVAFTSPSDNLVPGDTNDSDDVFVHDRVTGSTKRVSAASDGTQANSSSSQPAISADGRYVAFVSFASNLVPGDTDFTYDVFVHDRVTGSAERISVASDGTQANSHSGGPAISADGRYVAFQSDANNVVPGDTNFTDDVFVHDRVTESTRISVASDGTQANGASGDAAISADGRYVAFTSDASNLVPGDTNATGDVFLRDRQGVAPSDTTAPTVTRTSPVAGATGVAVTANVTGSFSEAMDASTLTSSTFTLKAGTTTVAAAVTYNSTDRVATLNPGADLAAGTTYTATIRGGSSGVKDVAGNALASDRTWTFTTAAVGGGTSETVTLTATADSYVSSGATGTNNGTSVMLGVDNSPVEATYLKFDLSAYAGRTLESATLQLRSAGSGSTGKQNVKLVANDSWTEGGITYSNRPALGTSIGTLGPTTTNTSYSVPLTVSGLTGELGQQLSLGMDSSSSDGLDLNSKEAGSTTAPKLVLTLSPSGGGGGGDTTAPTVMGTSPVAGATGVAVTANVTGSFSEAMDASTLTSSTFTLKAGTTTVAAAVTYNSTDRVATLNPGADLAAGTTYTATIRGGSSGVKDVAGNALASDRTWTFTTAAVGGGTSETVTLTATADSYVSGGATGTNNGTSVMLGVDNSPVEATYLKFDLSAYAGRTLESATLQLRSAGSGSTGKQNVKLVANDSWTEGGITYSNRPALGTSIGTLGPTTTNTSYSVPLTVSGLTGELGQQLSLGMDSSSSDGLDLNSKEAGSTTAPKLVLTLKK